MIGISTLRQAENEQEVRALRCLVDMSSYVPQCLLDQAVQTRRELLPSSVSVDN
jgi:hypothetical protein